MSDAEPKSPSGYWSTPQPKRENLVFCAGPTIGLTGRKTLPSGSKSTELYYRGHRWLGPINAVGQPGPSGRLVLIEISTGNKSFGIAPA